MSTPARLGHELRYGRLVDHSRDEDLAEVFADIARQLQAELTPNEVLGGWCESPCAGM